MKKKHESTRRKWEKFVDVLTHLKSLVSHMIVLKIALMLANFYNATHPDACYILAKYWRP